MNTIKKGTKGKAIQQIQEALNQRAFLLTDGIFGSKTELRLKQFQSLNGLKPTGEIDKATWDLLLPNIPFPGTNTHKAPPKIPGWINTRAHPLNKNIYYQQAVPKKAIVLHHTAGHTVNNDGSDNMNHVNGWNNSNIHVAAHFSISFSGKIYLHFPIENWSYHLGLKTATNKQMNSESIGIELTNEGQLQKQPNGTFKWFNNKINYLRPQDQPFQKKWRNFEFWAPYSKNQYQALNKLLPWLCSTFNIPFNIVDNNAYTPSLLDGKYKGIYTHANVRKDKFDVSPAFIYSNLILKKINRQSDSE